MNRLHIRCLGSFLISLQAVSLLLVLGCADNPRRASGEALRKATTQARVLYTQAHRILADPTRAGQDSSGEVLPAEALDLLDEAEARLGKALAQANSGNGEDMDQMLARQMLSMVRFLKGQYNYWTMQHYSRAVQGEVLRSRMAVQQLIQLHSTPAPSAGASDEVQAMKRKATETKAAAQNELKQINAEITSLDETINQRQAQIDAKTTQAIKLRSQSRLRGDAPVDGSNAGQRRLELLDKALALEQDVTRYQSELRQMRQDKADLQTRREQVQLTIDGAQAKIDLLSASRGDDGRGARALLAEDIKSWSAQLRDSIEAMTGHSARLLQLSMEAETAYDKSAQSAREALSQAPSTDKLSCLILQAEARTGMGNAHLLLWQVRSQLALLKDDLAGPARKTLGSSLPAFPAELQTYLGETAPAAENAVTYYTDAVDLYNKIVNQASRQQRWRYQQGQAWAYLIQAQALSAQGESDRQKQAEDKARELLPDILQGAKAAGEDDTPMPLQQRLEASEGA